MDKQIGKPPIDIREVEAGRGSKAEPGPLSYQEQVRKRYDREPRGGGGSWGLTFFGALVAVVVSAALIFTYFTPKKDLLTVADNINEVSSKLTTESGRINSITNTMGEYAKKSELGSYATASSLTSLSSTITSLGAKLSDLETQYPELSGQIDEIQTSLGSLGSDIVELEASVSILGEELGNIELGSELGILQAGIDAIKVNLDKAIADLVALSTKVDSQILSVSDNVTALRGSITGINSSLAGINTNLIQLDTRLDTVELHLTALEDLYDEWISTPRAIISKFRASYLEITPKLAGDYVILVTLYGTNLTDVVTSPSNASKLGAYLFGANSMLIIALEPKSPATAWKITDVIEITYTSGWVVSSAQVGVGSN